ncbi:MAG: chemotaxis protein [Hyphomicrobiales bacterium]|nr:MAG: chemotaxis protein [Hyphomicrobiales bacterium]
MMNLSYLSKAKYLLILVSILCVLNFGMEFINGLAMVNYYSVIGSLILLGSALLCMYYLRRCSQDLAQAEAVVSQVAQGDFEHRILNIHDQGEAKRFYWAVNSLIDNADAYVRESSAAMANVEQGKYYRIIMEDGLNGAYQRGAKTINQAMNVMSEKISGFESITQSFESNVEKVISQLSSASGELDKTAQQMDEVAGNTTVQASALSETATVTSKNVQTVSSATEELSSSIDEISNRIEISGVKIGQAVDEIRTTESNLDELNKSVNIIGDVVALINDIANQTNLLALNATIEASRAGDAGKGFAVVANEVKALAAQTSKATTEISGLVNSIQDATKLSLGSFKTVSDSVNEVDEITQTISSSIEQQNIATGEIARSISEVSQGSDQVTENVKKVSSGAEVSQQSAAGLIQAAAGISEQSGTLGEEVDRFLKEVRTAM